MRKQHRTCGYIIPLTLMIISAAVVIITYLYTRGSVYVPFIDTVIKREQAKTLAVSGIHIAMSQIAKPAELAAEKQQVGAQPKGQAEQKVQKPTADEQAKQLLTNLLSSINRWQTFALKDKSDGITGVIKIAITCEQGKIDINQIYDFDTKKFLGEGQAKDDWKKFLQEFFKRVENLTKASKLFESFEKFLKGRKYPLDDVSELLAAKEFESFRNKIFYEPPVSAKEEKRPVYLADIFTLYSGQEKLEPWLFSDSMLALLGIKRAQVDSVSREKSVQTWLKPFKRTAQWNQDWKTLLTPLYGQELQKLPQGLEALLATTFDPTVFSVVSYGTIGEITQRVYAIVERIERSLKDKTVYDVKIRKIYWL